MAINPLERPMFANGQPMPNQPIPMPNQPMPMPLANMGGMNQGADDYEGIMNALRGDQRSTKERRSELAQHVGEKDANQTPDSVLTLVQPLFEAMSVAEQGQNQVSLGLGLGQGEGIATLWGNNLSIVIGERRKVEKI